MMPILFAMSDAIMLQIVNIIATCIGSCFLAWIGYLTLVVKSNQTQNAAVAVKTAETAKAAATTAADTAAQVKDALQISTESRSKSLDDLAIVAKATHSLVNSSMETQLSQTASLARRLAELTQAPGDIDAANLAEKVYKEHLARQAEVDSQPGTDDQKAGIR